MSITTACEMNIVSATVERCTMSAKRCIYCTYMCLDVCVGVYIYVCMYACVHACMYACMHACMYACVYIHTFILLNYLNVSCLKTEIISQCQCVTPTEACECVAGQAWGAWHWHTNCGSADRQHMILQSYTPKPHLKSQTPEYEGFRVREFKV